MDKIEIEPQKKRNQVIDITKGFGMIIVILFHLLGMMPAIVDKLNIIFAGILGIYFILAGYFYKPGKRSKIENIWNRTKNLLVPFIIYYVLVCLFCTMWVFLSHGGTLKECLIDAWVYFYHGSFQPVGPDRVPAITVPFYYIMGPWFFPVMYLASIIFYLVADFAMKSIKHFSLTFIMLCVVTGVLTISLPVALFWDLQNCFALAALMLLGTAASRFDLVNKYFSKITLKNTIIAILSLAIVIFINTSKHPIQGLDLSHGFFGPEGFLSLIIYIIETTIMTFYFLYIGCLINYAKGLTRFFSWVGRNTISILSLHMPLICFSACLILTRGFVFDVDAILGKPILLFLVGAILSFGFMLLVIRGCEICEQKIRNKISASKQKRA